MKKQVMKRSKVLLLVLLGVAAYGRSLIGAYAAIAIPQNQFHGITAVTSRFDSSTSPQNVRLDFINDSPSNITAWAYCVYADKVKDSDPNQGFCTMTDATAYEIDRQVQEKITLQTNPGDLPTYHFVHPGEHKTISASFALPVSTASIQIKLIAYSDGTAETSPDEKGTSYFTELLQGREAMVKLNQDLVNMGQKILGDATDPHPAQTMIAELQNRANEWGMDNTLHLFKRPEWRQGNDKEFVSQDESGYLRKFVAEREMKATEFSRYLMRGVR